MTAYATRSPLQLLSNPHMMSDLRRTTRRTSARLADKEDIPVINGAGNTAGKGIRNLTNGHGNKAVKANINGASNATAGGRAKRKLGV